MDSGTVDAVVTTVPHYLHTEIAIYCLERGMNVLVEKPAGVYAKSVREMNECAAAHPETAFGIMFNQRTNRLYQQVKDIIESGELGQIRRSNWIINPGGVRTAITVRAAGARPGEERAEASWLIRLLISWICGSGYAESPIRFTQNASMAITGILLWRTTLPLLRNILAERPGAL